MDLSLIPIEHLADEIIKRGETGIVFVIGLGQENKGYVHWGGDYYQALGLCIEMQEQIKEDSVD